MVSPARNSCTIKAIPDSKEWQTDPVWRDGCQSASAEGSDPFLGPHRIRSTDNREAQEAGPRREGERDASRRRNARRGVGGDSQFHGRPLPEPYGRGTFPELDAEAAPGSGLSFPRTLLR